MVPIVRRAEERDLAAALQVFLASLADVRRRHGAPPVQQDEEDCRNGYQHIFKTGIFYVAELDGRIVGTANGIIRDQIWFLTGFWMLPEHQGKGIGKKLLTSAMKAAEQDGADCFFVWASVDPPAIGNYMHAGMLPGYQIFSYQLAQPALANAESHGKQLQSGYQLVDLDVAAAAKIDSLVRGTGREVDHEYWLSDNHRVGKLVVCDEQPVAYFYVRKGRIGPVSYLHDKHEQLTLNLAIEAAARQAEAVTLAIPGINRSATEYFISLNAKLVSSSHFLTSKSFGQLERYIPSGPLLY